MRSLVINCSSPHYNLAAHKITDWLRSLGEDVERVDHDVKESRKSRRHTSLFYLGYDKVYLSVIFSQDAIIARDIALSIRSSSDVYCGGPGMTRLQGWWERETGLPCYVGLDKRFEQQTGCYKMTFASRGCPVNCSFCIVPQLEGRKFTLNWDFVPAPVLCDNNLSALPVTFQDHIIQRYQDTGTKLLDANSGFEPRTFNVGTYRRWKPVLAGPWRFAYDELAETKEVARMMQILKEESPKRKRVYVLLGNEPIECCYERAMKVVEWGGEPFCQIVTSLDHLGGPLPMSFDWTEQLAIDMRRYFNRFLWRYIPISQYQNRKGEEPPFASVSIGRTRISV